MKIYAWTVAKLYPVSSNCWKPYDETFLIHNNNHFKINHDILVQRQKWKTPEQFVKFLTPGRHHLRRSGVFIVNFEHISHNVLLFPLPTLNK